MTYSIVARDPGSGELGIGVQSRYFAAGRVVPWIESGVGVIASQAFAEPAYGYEGLRALRAGAEPQAVLDRLRRGDPGEATRQVAILDSEGRIAVHTGARCVAAAGHAIGVSCCAQANMMAQGTVWQAMVDAFAHAEGELADRLLAALEAAEREGGDLRGRQAASLIVVSGQTSGVPRLDRAVDLRVDDHPDPVGELRRLLGYARVHRRARRAREAAGANDLATALAELDRCCEAYPAEPEFLVHRALVLLRLGRTGEAREGLRQAQAIHAGWGEFVLRFADAGVTPIGREALASLLA